MPLSYLLIGLGLNQYVFKGDGMLPLADALSLTLLFAGGVFVMLLWYMIGRQTQRQAQILHPLKGDTEEFAKTAFHLQLRLVLLCDLAALPGLVLFVMDADLIALFAFVIASSLCYLKTLPSGQALGLNEYLV